MLFNLRSPSSTRLALLAYSVRCTKQGKADAKLSLCSPTVCGCAFVGFPDGLAHQAATQIALRFPPSARLASLAYSVRLGQDSATLQGKGVLMARSIDV